MHIISMVIVGFIIGVIAKFVHPGRDSMGFIATTLLGIGGALLAAFLGQALGLYGPGEPAGFVGAIVGAIVLLVVYGRLKAPSAAA